MIFAFVPLCQSAADVDIPSFQLARNGMLPLWKGVLYSQHLNDSLTYLIISFYHSTFCGTVEIIKTGSPQ